MSAVTYYLGDEPSPQRGGAETYANAPESRAKFASAAPLRGGRAPSIAAPQPARGDKPANGQVLDVTA